jgi:hypothetical protein
MVKKYLLLIFALSLTVPLTLITAQDRDSVVVVQRKAWCFIDDRFCPQPTDTTYRFHVIFVEGETSCEAYRRAEDRVCQIQDGATIRLGVTKDCRIEVRSIPRIEYREKHKDGYHIWQLVQIAKHPDLQLPSPSQGYLDKAKRDALGLKPFIPGAAQLYKGSKTKACVIWSGMGAPLAAGFLSEKVIKKHHNDAKSKIKGSSTIAKRDLHTRDAKRLRDTHNTLVVSAIAIPSAFYIYSLFDGYYVAPPNNNNKRHRLKVQINKDGIGAEYTNF